MPNVYVFLHKHNLFSFHKHGCPFNMRHDLPFMWIFLYDSAKLKLPDKNLHKRVHWMLLVGKPVSRCSRTWHGLFFAIEITFLSCEHRYFNLLESKMRVSTCDFRIAIVRDYAWYEPDIKRKKSLLCSSVLNWNDPFGPKANLIWLGNANPLWDLPVGLLTGLVYISGCPPYMSFYTSPDCCLLTLGHVISSHEVSGGVSSCMWRSAGEGLKQGDYDSATTVVGSR